MPSGPRIVWSTHPRTLAAGLGRLERRYFRQLKNRAQHVAVETRSWMRNNRPWTDRTGNARANLNASARVNAVAVTIAVEHGVFYGPFLEFGTRNMYPRPILGPGRDHAADLLMSSLPRL